MSIEIRDVRAICTAPEGINLVAVKIETNEPELYGVGCATFAHRYSAVVTVINDYLRPFLIGKDPSNIEDIWQSVMGMSYWRNGPVLNNALSGVDMALWDIKGKMAGMPLYQLFGGKCRAAIPCYTHAEGDSVDVVLERVAALKELGYRKIRVQVGGYGGKNPSMHRPENSPPGAYFDPKSYIRNVLNLMEILHVKYAGELEFCHDTHERLSPIDAVNFAKELEPYHLLFLEDALPPEQSDWFRILRQQCATPLAMGELFNNPQEWKHLVQEHSADDWGRFWLDKFNVDFDIIAVTMDPSDWDERLRIWINSGDMPDVANAQFEFGELENYANQEAIYRLPDDWKERWPNVAKTQENVPAAAMAEEQLGGTYFLYRPVFSLNRPSERLSYHALIYLRKDWMEACGLELKDTYTPDELKEIAKTFLEKDPGNVGDNLVGMSIRPYDMVKLYPTTTFSEACNIGDGYYKDENGQFQWAPADTRTLDALKNYQDLYQEGILDSEFYSYTRYQGAQKFYVQGTSGLTLEDGHAIMITYIRNGLAEQGLDPDKVLHLAQLVGDDGMYHYREDSNYWGQVMFSPTISQEKFERAMDILDYTCTEEGQNFMNMGFEGIDWKLDENGNYVSLLDPSIQGSATSVLGGKYPSKESSFGGLILPDDFSLVSPNYNHEIQDTVRGFYKLREELSDTTTLLPREYEYEFLSSREKSQATMDLGDEYAKLVLKDGDLEDNWNTWVEEKMAVVQPVLDQLNK